MKFNLDFICHMFFSCGFDMLAYIVVKFANLEYLDGQAKTLMITVMTPSWECYKCNWFLAD